MFPNQQIAETLRLSLESFGYKPIDVPIIEHTDLFLTKSGEEIISKMYSVPVQESQHLPATRVHGLHRPRLRQPPAGQSPARAPVLCRAGLPLREATEGPLPPVQPDGRRAARCARPLADAEILRCACDGLDKLGLRDYQVVIGHIGVVLDLLRAFQLDRRARCSSSRTWKAWERRQGHRAREGPSGRLYPARTAPASRRACR